MMEDIPLVYKATFALIIWSSIIHLIDENLQALLILLGIIVNCYSAYYCMDGPLEQRNFKGYIIHIIFANILLLWYCIISAGAVSNTLLIWHNGFYGEKVDTIYSGY